MRGSPWGRAEDGWPQNRVGSQGAGHSNAISPQPCHSFSSPYLLSRTFYVPPLLIGYPPCLSSSLLPFPIPIDPYPLVPHLFVPLTLL